MYYTYRQEKGGSNAKHIRSVKSIVAAVEHLGYTMFADKGLTKMEKEKDAKKDAITKSDDKYRKVVRGKVLGVIF